MVSLWLRRLDSLGKEIYSYIPKGTKSPWCGKEEVIMSVAVNYIIPVPVPDKAVTFLSLPASLRASLAITLEGLLLVLPFCICWASPSLEPTPA